MLEVAQPRYLGLLNDLCKYLANGVFDVDARNKPWVRDITCIPTGEGWLHLAAAIDARHRRAVGWVMGGRIAEKLAMDAPSQAVGRENPPDGYSLVFHDD